MSSIDEMFFNTTQMSSTDTSQSVSSLVTSRSADAAVPYTHRQQQAKKPQTYRGVESRSYNSNVRIGKLQTYPQAESNSHQRHRRRHIVDTELLSNASYPRSKHVFVNDSESSTSRSLPRGKEAFVKDSKSLKSSMSSRSSVSRGKQSFIKDSGSSVSDPSRIANTTSGVGIATPSEWQKVVSTSRSVHDDKDGNEHVPRALNECAECTRDKVRLKLLPCLHSFCTDCLDGHVQQASSNTCTCSLTNNRHGLIKCPLCSRRFEIPSGGVADLDDNAYTGLNDNSISENDRCTACSVDVPKCRCSDCNLLFCTECVKEHLRNERDKSHYIVNVATEMVGKAPQTSLCGEHESFALTLYCVNCSKLICGRCAIGKHSNHIVDDIHIAASDRRDDLRDFISVGNTNRMTRELADYMHRSKKERTRVQTDVDRTVTAVQNHVRKLKEELDEFEKNIIQSIEEKERSVMETLDTKVNDTELQLRSTHLTLETMRIVNERARDIELIEKYPNLKSLACDLRNSGRAPLTQCVRLSYTPLVHTLKSSIGRVNIDSSLQKQIQFKEMCSFHLFKHITSIYPIDATKAWVSFRKYMQLCCKDGSFGVRLDLGEPVCCLAGNSNQTVFVGCKTCMKVLGTNLSPKFLFQLPHEPSDMRFTDVDNIIIVFKDARRVSMFSAKGKALKEFDLRHLGYRLGMRVNEPWKLDINRENGDIFISDYVSETIAVFNKESDIKTAFATTVYRHGSIAFGKGLLFLTDYKRDCVHIYSTDGHLLQTCRVAGINSPCSIALDDVSDVWIGAWGGMVKVYAQR